MAAGKRRKAQAIQNPMRESSPRDRLDSAEQSGRKAASDDLSKRTGKVLATLSPREEIVLRLRFGIGSDASRSIEEVSQKFSLTPKRIHQIQLKAFAKLRNGSGHFE